MKRREFISLLCGAAAMWPIATRAQGKAVRLVYLAELSPEATPRLWNLFREELRSRGWTEGANLTITPRWGAQLSDALAHELVTLKPDAIVAWATPAVAAAQRATKSIPIVMVGVADPVAVDSLTAWRGRAATLPVRPTSPATSVANCSNSWTNSSRRWRLSPS